MEELEKTVMAYLRKRGFKQTEFAHLEDYNRISSSSSSSQIDSRSKSGPARYHDGYSKAVIMGVYFIGFVPLSIITG